EKAVDSLLALVAQGHQVMVAAQYFSDYFTHRLGIYTSANFTKNTDTFAIVHLQKEKETLSFKHDSYNYDLLQHFKNIDGNPGYLIMGTNEYQNPNFVLFQIGKGHLWVHCSPAVFSNYFLLREGKQQYLETVMSQVSAPVSKVYWSDFKHFSESHSDWSVLWNARATRIALLLTILGIIIYIAFEMKRKQKMIPIIPPVENASVAFVETIGRLYYNKKNHSNLAEKMAQHFLEYIRQQYYLNTSNLDLEFIQQLSARSGKPLDLTQALIYQVKAAQAGKISKEQDLFSFYSQIQQFTHGRK